MPAPETHDVYPLHPGDPRQHVADPADLGTAFGLDASFGPDDAPRSDLDPREEPVTDDLVHRLQAAGL
jgi:hypothetical protein